MIKDFSKKRTENCEELMRPEIKALLNLSLDEKIKKTKKIVEDAVKKYPKIGIGFSGGTDSLVILHLTLPIKPDLPIIFVNTYHQFPETYDYIEKVKKEWGVKNFYEVKAEKDRFEEFKKKFGLKTSEFTEICCGYHKISPLKKAIADLGLNAFIAGIRGVEHEERAKETIFSPREDHIRVHPLLFWRQKDVLDYVKRYNLECNPLYAEGYTSLGCVHCTEKNPDPNKHERAGRGEVREKIMERLRNLGYT